MPIQSTNIPANVHSLCTMTFNQAREDAQNRTSTGIENFENIIAHIPSHFFIDYLDPISRRSMCWVSRTFYDCLHKLVYTESVLRHIPLTRTVSAVQQVLREIRRADPRRQMELWVRLAKQITALPTYFRRRAIETMLAAAETEDQRALYVAALGPESHQASLNADRTHHFDTRPHAATQAWIFRALRDAEEQKIYDIACAMLMKHTKHQVLQDSDFNTLLNRVRSSRTGNEKAALLQECIQAYRGSACKKGDQSDTSSWNTLFQECRSLSEEHRSPLLCGLAARASTSSPEETAERWNCLFKFADTASPGEQLSIYTGMVALLGRLPGTVIPIYFERLWERCNRVNWNGRGDLLKRMAEACSHHDGLFIYADRIITTALNHSTGPDRIEPIRILVQRYPYCSTNLQLPRTTTIPHERLTAEEWSVLICDCGSSRYYDGKLAPLLEQTVGLPLSVRHLALAGIVHNHYLVNRAGGKTWIDQQIMPLLKDIPLSHRANVLRNLAALALDAHQRYQTGNPSESLLSDSTWNLVQSYIQELEPAHRADLILSLCNEAGNRVDHPVWSWTFEQCQTLPRYLQAPILHALASAKQRAYTSDPRPLQKLLPRIAALPKLYRAFPTYAATAMRKELDFTDSLRTMFPMLRLLWSLPAEDSI